MKAAEQLKGQRWEDIVFEYRNKAYGAYLIRQTYSRHVIVSAAITVIVAALILAYPTIAEWIRGQQEAEEVVTKTVKYTDLAPPPPIENKPPPPKLDIPPPVKTIIKYLPPQVTDKEIVEEEEMPTVEEIKNNDVGAENIEGTGEVIFEEPVEEVVDEGPGDQIFTVVEQMPEFEGGLEAMMKFISKNLKYPSAARRMGIEGQVFVQFVVDAEGKISEVKTIKGISAECDKEAERVIKMMPPWKAGKQNGKPVKVRFVLPIRFKLAT